jgi:hypothetical protein
MSAFMLKAIPFNLEWCQPPKHLASTQFLWQYRPQAKQHICHTTGTAINCLYANPRLLAISYCLLEKVKQIHLGLPEVKVWILIKHIQNNKSTCLLHIKHTVQMKHIHLFSVQHSQWLPVRLQICGTWCHVICFLCTNKEEPSKLKMEVVGSSKMSLSNKPHDITFQIIMTLTFTIMRTPCLRLPHW